MSDVTEQGHLRQRPSEKSEEDTIVSRFERQVAATPDKQAIVTDEMSLGYRALDLRANCIAAALSSLPSRHDRPIVLFMRDETTRIAAMLGAIKANRIFVPLAPDSPRQWVTQVIDESGATDVIADRITDAIASEAAGNAA